MPGSRLSTSDQSLVHCCSLVSLIGDLVRSRGITYLQILTIPNCLSSRRDAAVTAALQSTAAEPRQVTSSQLRSAAAVISASIIVYISLCILHIYINFNLAKVGLLVIGVILIIVFCIFREVLNVFRVFTA